MSEQENARPSLRGIESARSQITGKFKAGEEEDTIVKTEKIDAVDDFFSRLGVGDIEKDIAADDIIQPEELHEVRNVRDIFADLTAEKPSKEDTKDSGDILKPEISYQDIASEEKEEEAPVDIYTRDEEKSDVAEDMLWPEKAESDADAEEDPFFKKLQSAAAPVSEPKSFRPIQVSPVSGNTLITVQEQGGNISISFEKEGKNVVSLKMPVISIPDGHSVSASLAPDISLVLSYARGRSSVLSIVLDHGGETVKTEIASGSPSLRKIAFGGMEFEVFAGAEVEAGVFSIAVKEDRIFYRY